MKRRFMFGKPQCNDSRRFIFCKSQSNDSRRFMFGKPQGGDNVLQKKIAIMVVLFLWKIIFTIYIFPKTTHIYIIWQTLF